MNIDVRKQEILNNLYMLKNECKFLLDIIPKVIEELLKVKTEEDAAQFDENFDSLFESLNLITLYWLDRWAGMNIDVRKQEILNDLYTLENECKILLDRIPKVREDLLKVKTEEDAVQFNENIDIFFEGINLIIE